MSPQVPGLVIYLMHVCWLATFGRSCQAVRRKRNENAATATATQARPQPAARPAVCCGRYCRPTLCDLNCVCVCVFADSFLRLHGVLFVLHRGGASHQSFHSRVHSHGSAAAARPGGHIQRIVTYSSRAGARFHLRQPGIKAFASLIHVSHLALLSW